MSPIREWHSPGRAGAATCGFATPPSPLPCGAIKINQWPGIKRSGAGGAGRARGRRSPAAVRSGRAWVAVVSPRASAVSASVCVCVTGAARHAAGARAAAPRAALTRCRRSRRRARRCSPSPSPACCAYVSRHHPSHHRHITPHDRTSLDWSPLV